VAPIFRVEEHAEQETSLQQVASSPVSVNVYVVHDSSNHLNTVFLQAGCLPLSVVFAMNTMPVTAIHAYILGKRCEVMDWICLGKQVMSDTV
jgi:hypothetical protein